MTRNPFNQALDWALQGKRARVRDEGTTYEGWVDRVHHGRGSVLLHDVTTDDGEHRAAVFIRSPGTVSVLEAGKNIELRPLDELEPFPEHPRDYEPKDGVVRRCARNRFAGSFPVVRESGEILNGHKRVTAARRAGLDRHPVEVVAVTDDQALELYQIAHRSHDHDSGDPGDEEPDDSADEQDSSSAPA